MRLRGAEPDGDGKRWGARGGGGGSCLPDRRTDRGTSAPPLLATRSLPVRPSKRWARLGARGERCCSRTAQNLPGACGGSHRPPESLGSAVLDRERKARIFHQKEQKKKIMWRRFDISKLFVRKSPPGTSLGEPVARGIALRGGFGVRSGGAGLGKSSCCFSQLAARAGTGGAPRAPLPGHRFS